MMLLLLLYLSQPLLLLQEDELLLGAPHIMARHAAPHLCPLLALLLRPLVIGHSLVHRQSLMVFKLLRLDLDVVPI